MMRPRDPRIRQRINQISHNLESANESAQEGIYTFSQNYISPCLSGIGQCVQSCTAPCFPSREDQLRRRRRGRAEANFDFYDDWETEEGEESLLGWGTGELDRLLAGSGLSRGSTSEQPRRQRKLSYGTRQTRRRSTVHTSDSRDDPTVIPKSSFLGFLERLPWRIGPKGLKYRPSAADLQEHPGSHHRHVQEDEPLMEASEDEQEHVSYQNGGRQRSATQSSRGTTNSLSSRGDLFPSDEEDAVPLDDEFALTLGRRNTGLESDDQSGNISKMARSSSGTSSLGGASSKNPKRRKKRRSSTKTATHPDSEVASGNEMPSLADLKVEEEQVAQEEESAVESKRIAAQDLAIKRGLESSGAITSSPVSISNSPGINPPFISNIQTADSTPIPMDSTQSRRDPLLHPSFEDDLLEPFPPFTASASSIISNSPTAGSVPPRPGSVKDAGAINHVQEPRNEPSDEP